MTNVQMLEDKIFTAFCEAGTNMRFDVAQQLLRTMAKVTPKRDRGYLEPVIAVYGHLHILTSDNFRHCVAA
jgi:hypothetical protein